MGNADLALDLLMCDNYGECCAMAEALEDVNNQRRAIEAELSDIAKEQAGRIYHGQRALVVARRGLARGREGYRGFPPREHLRGAGAPVHHRRATRPAVRGAPWAT